MLWKRLSCNKFLEFLPTPKLNLCPVPAQLSSLKITSSSDSDIKVHPVLRAEKFFNILKMNRRSNSTKIEKYSLVRYEADSELGICKTDLIKLACNEELYIGATCEAPFKGKYYSAIILAMNGKIYI